MSNIIGGSVSYDGVLVDDDGMDMVEDIVTKVNAIPKEKLREEVLDMHIHFTTNKIMCDRLQTKVAEYEKQNKELRSCITKAHTQVQELLRFMSSIPQQKL